MIGYLKSPTITLRVFNMCTLTSYTGVFGRAITQVSCVFLLASIALSPLSFAQDLGAPRLHNQGPDREIFVGRLSMESYLLQWSSPSGTLNNRVQIAASDDFVAPVIDVTVGNTFNSKLLNLLPLALPDDARYFWRVKALGDGIESAWSATGEFRVVHIPRVESIGSRPRATGAEIFWYETQGAESYQAQLALSRSFDDFAADVTDAAFNIFIGNRRYSFDISNLERRTVYYWRVRGVSATHKGAWSAPRLIVTQDGERPVGSPDLRESSISEIEFQLTNDGRLGWNELEGLRQFSWPRASANSYLFGGGIWFGARKRSGEEVDKLVVMSYDPNSGRSWMTPGRSWLDPESTDRSAHRLHFGLHSAMDFDADGRPIDGSNIVWPLRVLPGKVLARDGYRGSYLDPFRPDLPTVTPPPAFLSSEDIFTTFHDGDLDNYATVNSETLEELAYPIGLQFEQTVYTWKSGRLKDVMILHYKMINTSQDTLFDCYFGPALDFDILPVGAPREGASNEETRYYEEDSELSLAMQWSDVDQGEADRGFGYVGVTFTQTPAVDGDSFVRRDKAHYGFEEQMGIASFRNWVIYNDPTRSHERYDFMAANVRDGASGASDKRFLMTCGPFSLRPGDTTEAAYAILFAAPALGDNPDGSTEDVANLVSLARAVRSIYETYTTVDVSAETADAGANHLQILGISPNPASQEAVASFSLATPNRVELRLRDIFGRSVYAASLPPASGMRQIRIPSADLAAGSYILTLSAGGQQRSARLQIVR